jgi:integrase
MGNLFKRKKNGKESPTWQMRYRVWDNMAGDWGHYRYESTNTTIEREAANLLLERERREERRKNGLEACEAARIALSKAIAEFLEKTQAWDRAVPERNRAKTHPVFGTKVQGTAWWIRTLDFAGEVLRFFGDVEMVAIAEPGRVEALDKALATRGGTRGKGVSTSTRHKVLVWFRRFTRWCVKRGYLPHDLFGDFEVPREVVERRERIISEEEEAQFWAEYEALPLMAKVRVGLVLHTGARSGEVETIRVSDVAPQFGTVRRRLWKKSPSDSPKETVVRVPPHLMAVLERWIETKGLGPNDRLLRIRCQAGGKFLRRWATSLRGLRRTVLTRLHDSGVPLRVIMEAAGHAQLDTTQRYLGVGETAVNDALSMLPWAREGAIKSAIIPRHQNTTDRDITRQDDQERVSASESEPSR